MYVPVKVLVDWFCFMMRRGLMFSWFNLRGVSSLFHITRLCLLLGLSLSACVPWNLPVFLSLVLSVFFFFFSWRYFVVTVFTKVSLCAARPVCLSPRLRLSPSFSVVAPFWHRYRDSALICLSPSEFLSISLPFPSPRLLAWFHSDVTEVVWASLSRSNVCLACWCFFLFLFLHQRGLGRLEVKKLYISA